MTKTNKKPFISLKVLDIILIIIVSVIAVLLLYLIILMTPLEQYLPFKLNFYHYKTEILATTAVLVIFLNILGIHKMKR